MTLCIIFFFYDHRICSMLVGSPQQQCLLMSLSLFCTYNITAMLNRGRKQKSSPLGGFPPSFCNEGPHIFHKQGATDPLSSSILLVRSRRIAFNCCRSSPVRIFENFEVAAGKGAMDPRCPMKVEKYAQSGPCASPSIPDARLVCTRSASRMVRCEALPPDTVKDPK